MVFSQLKIPANLAQVAVPKMHCLYANAVVQASMQRAKLSMLHGMKDKGSYLM